MAPRDLKAALAVMEIRGLQRKAAEMQVETANAHLRQLDARRRESVENLKLEMEAWSRNVTGLTVGLEISAAWSKVILQGEAELGQTDLRISEAKTDRDRLGQAWAAATARSDAATTMGRTLLRRARRQQEELELAAFADLFAQRRWMS